MIFITLDAPYTRPRREFNELVKMSKTSPAAALYWRHVRCDAPESTGLFLPGNLMLTSRECCLAMGHLLKMVLIVNFCLFILSFSVFFTSEP